MYTFEELQAVAAAARDIANVVAQTRTIRLLVTATTQVAVCAGDWEPIRSESKLALTFTQEAGRWELTDITHL